MRYLKEIEDDGLYYRKHENIELRDYTDVDWAGNIDDIKNTNGEEFFLGKRLVTRLTRNKIVYLNLLLKLNMWLIE